MSFYKSYNFIKSKSKNFKFPINYLYCYNHNLITRMELLNLDVDFSEFTYFFFNGVISKVINFIARIFFLYDLTQYHFIRCV